MPFNGNHTWNHGKPVWNKGKAMKPPAKFKCQNCGKKFSIERGSERTNSTIQRYRQTGNSYCSSVCGMAKKKRKLTGRTGSPNGGYRLTKNGRKRIIASLRSRKKTVAERLWGKVHKTHTCWLWTGKTQVRGYGRLFVKRTKSGLKAELTHRISWELARGPIPSGLWVLHKCDNPACVRPSHLFLGTQRDNVLDAVKKGRYNYVSRLRHRIKELEAEVFSLKCKLLK